MTSHAQKLAKILVTASVLDTAFADPLFEAYYRGDILHNSSGGLNAGGTYLDDAGLTFSASLGSPFAADDSSIFVYLLYNNRATFSDTYSGDAQTLSNIDTGESIRIYEFWYEQVWSERFSLRVGLYDLNSEFDAIDTAGLFMNSSHGIGAEFAQSGETGPSIFPLTSLALRFDWGISRSSTLRYALLDGVPGDPNNPSRTAILLDSKDGVLHALEYNHVFDSDTRLGIGAWLYSSRFDRIEGENVFGEPLREDGNGGVYGFIETPILPVDNLGMDAKAYLRYGIANDDLNPLRSYLGGGLVLSGLFELRPDDQLGIAFASAELGSPFKRVAASSGDYVQDRETSIELTYSAQINDWLRLQPDIQYVTNPGFDPASRNALVFGLQFEMTMSHSWQ